MRGISVFFYSVRQGIKSMRKNRMFTLASIGTMAACLFLFGMFYFIVSNFNHMVKEVETSVGVTVFFEEDISQEQIDSIGEAIKARDEVDHMEFISAEKAWEQFVKENFKDNPELVKSFGTDNPLKDSASWQVFIKDISAQELKHEPQDLSERFVRGDESRGTEGSGLGLSIARHLPR